MSRTAALLFTAAWLAAAAAAQAGPAAEVRRGEQIARGQCSACHVVAPNQEFPRSWNSPVQASRASPTGLIRPRSRCTILWHRPTGT